MPPEAIDEMNPEPGNQLFQSFLDPNDPNFNEQKAILLYDVIRYCQMHSVNHNPTCFKYGKKRCARFPRKKYPQTSFDPESGVFCLKRDDPWLNGFNDLIAITLRVNHDCQFLFTKDYALAVVHYVIKYISKTEQRLHSKLTICAALRGAMNDVTSGMARSMLLKTYNKLESYREVGIPKIISHLLNFDDHFTSGTFIRLHTSSLLHYICHLSVPDRESDPADADNGFDSDIIVSESGYSIVSTFDDYAYRGSGLEDICLYDYTILFYKRKRMTGKIFIDQHPQSTTHRQICRTKDSIPVPILNGILLRFDPDSTDETIQQDYFCLLSALFLPWSSDDDTHKPEPISWEDYFQSNQHRLCPWCIRYIENIKLLHKSKEESKIDRLQ
jgi:hypothetical protein